MVIVTLNSDQSVGQLPWGGRKGWAVVVVLIGTVEGENGGRSDCKIIVMLLESRHWDNLSDFLCSWSPSPLCPSAHVCPLSLLSITGTFISSVSLSLSLTHTHTHTHTHTEDNSHNHHQQQHITTHTHTHTHSLTHFTSFLPPIGSLSHTWPPSSQVIASTIVSAKIDIRCPPQGTVVLPSLAPTTSSPSFHAPLLHHFSPPPPPHYPSSHLLLLSYFANYPCKCLEGIE